MVFVDETAEEVPAHDPGAGQGWLVCFEGRSQLQASVWPDGVVVRDVHRQDPLQVAWRDVDVPRRRVKVACAAPALLQAYAVRMEPNSQAAERFSRSECSVPL